MTSTYTVKAQESLSLLHSLNALALCWGTLTKERDSEHFQSILKKIFDINVSDRYF